MKYLTNQFSKILTLSIVFALLGFAALAQQMPTQMEIKEDFKDSELKEFVKVNLELMPIQEKSQEGMLAAIEASGLTVERFQELAQAQQGGNLTDVAESAEEMAMFNEAGQKVMGMQQDMQTEIQQVIEDSKLSQQEFQQLYMAYTQSAKVKAKVDEMMAKELN
ncbi:DUF4168 domain-containing protein [Belliella pelovolcani]|uniref:Uncharacterized protein n=1 Tax=Belliella pelovolcani TaxID=529505 RepID=A0A1N7N6E5_9BACT|nr:DUF4168 domain-containing protein [Belliella pelovolcani]SIS93926.1 protein of unknown function [Belliella pelovolcani]